MKKFKEEALKVMSVISAEKFSVHGFQGFFFYAAQ